MPTLAVLRQELAKDLGVYQSGAATSGSTITLVDGNHTSPFDANDPENKYQESWVYFTSGTNDGKFRRIAPNGGYSPVDYQISWVNPPSAAVSAVSAADTYEIYGFHPDQLKRWINRGLQRLGGFETRTLLSLVSDGDMESTATSAWTATTATLTKNTSRVLFGARALRVANSSTNGRATSTAVTVVPGEPFWLAAGCSVASGTASLVAYDATNSATIATIASSQTNAPYRVFCGTFTTPTGCKSLEIRLIGAESNADIYWDHVQLLRTEDRVLPLPSWVTQLGQIKDIEYLPLSSAPAGTGSVYTVNELGYRPVPFWHAEFDATAASNRLNYGWNMGEALLFLRGLRRYSALSADSDTTAADQTWVLAAAHVEAAMEMIQATASADSSRWKEHLAHWGPRLTQLTGRRMPRQRHPIQIAGLV